MSRFPKLHRSGWSMSDGIGPDIWDGKCICVEWFGFVLEISWGRRGR